MGNNYNKRPWMILRYVTQIWILSLYVRSLSKSQVNPLHPKISMHILHTDHTDLCYWPGEFV